MTDLRAALQEVADLGAFFAASADPAEAVDPTWKPWRAFYAGPDVMAARVEMVARALGTADRRVAASIALQGLAARLVSPVIAVATVHRFVPRWTPDSLHWRPAVSGPWPLWESDPDGGTHTVRDDAELAAGVARALVEPHLSALVEVTRAVESVSGLVLRGNVASAVASAGALVAGARPSASRTGSVIVAGLLRSPLLSGTGGFEAGWTFRRRSCCLYYRIPGGGTCGDCVLAERVRQQVRAGPAERPGD